MAQATKDNNFTTTFSLKLKNQMTFEMSGTARMYLKGFSFFVPSLIFIIILGIFIANSIIPSHSSGNIVVPIRNLIILFLFIILLSSGILSYLYCFPPQNFCWGDY